MRFSPATAPDTMAVEPEDRLPRFCGNTRKLMGSSVLFLRSAVEKLTHCPASTVSIITIRKTTGGG